MTRVLVRALLTVGVVLAVVLTPACTVQGPPISPEVAAAIYLPAGAL
ncbi:MAG: hypothetical protein GY778_26600 [bacterium]|nr:hypothetical protein [bacterium]